ATLLAVDPTGLSFRDFPVPASGVVSISGLTVTHGFANHEYGGGILNAGQLTLVACAVSKNRSDGGTTGGAAGGGIYNTGTLTVRDSTVSGNLVDSAVYIVSGAGIYNSGQLFLDNSTVSGNLIWGVGDGYGGGIYAGGIVQVRFSTVTNNQDTWCTSGSGPGIFVAGTLSVRDTIVAGNASSWCGPAPNIYGSYTGDHNVIDLDAKLGVLKDNGGPTMTHKLLMGSPAIDAGDNTDAPEWDQRGPGFPRIVNGTIDIGSYEVQAAGAAPGAVHLAGAFAPAPVEMGAPAPVPAKGTPAVAPDTPAEAAVRPGANPAPVRVVRRGADAVFVDGLSLDGMG